MKKIILIGYGKSKRKEKSKAEDLYTGSYFGKNLQLAKKYLMKMMIYIF